MRSSGTLLFALSALLTQSYQQENPQVDLGYEIHEGIYNTSTGNYKFGNIRYAQPPVGELRFAAPVPPGGRSTQVENGSVPVLCPQGNPAWQYIAAQFSAWFIAGNSSEFNFTAAEIELEQVLATLGPVEPDPATTEDCLFLDVVVPQAIFDNANNRYRKRQDWTDHRGGVPVVIWIYGGGYTLGSKDWYDPAGLVKASQADGGPGMIYVAMNYRLGAMGWLSGSTMKASGGTPNAGFHDQRLAIEWVRDNIHLFGGDASQITIMGESAGGGSVEHQITAYGGKKPISFQKAIPQSPGFYPIRTDQVSEDSTQDFFKFANVTSLEEARQLDSATVIAANALQVGSARYGSFVYNPTLDGDFVPDLPGVLLAEGAHAKDVQILVGHQAHESPAFSPPWVKTNEELREYLGVSFPYAQASDLDYIVDELYPDVYDGTYPYTTLQDRLFLMIAEMIFTCNTNYINKAFDGETYAYEFEVPPALHGYDVRSTFYNGQGDQPQLGIVAAIAEIHQAYITNFIMTGDPNGPGLAPFPMQGANASMNAWDATGVSTVKDDTANPRCAWWQKGSFA